MIKFARKYQSRLVIGIPLGLAGVALGYAVHDAPWVPRFLVWFIATVMVLTAMGAFISTSVVIEEDGTFSLRTCLLGLPLSTIRLAAGKVQQVELKADYSSMTIDHDPGISTSKSLRVKLQVRHAEGVALVQADSVRLPQNWSPPDNDEEVITLMQNGGKGELLESARSMASALGCPVTIIRD